MKGMNMSANYSVNWATGVPVMDDDFYELVVKRVGVSFADRIFPRLLAKSFQMGSRCNYTLTELDVVIANALLRSVLEEREIPAHTEILIWAATMLITGDFPKHKADDKFFTAMG